VRAVNAAGEGAASEVTGTPQAPPRPPSRLTALPGDGFVTLSWDDPSDPGLIGYQVRYVETPMPLPETWDDIDGSDANTTSHTIGNLTNGRGYVFHVRAVNEAGPGAPAGVVSRPGGPRAPEGLSASAGEGAVTLSWDDPDDGKIAGYEVRYAERGTPLPEVWDAISHSDSSTTAHEVAGLTNGTRYAFEVRGVNAVGPGPPSGLTAAPGAHGLPSSIMGGHASVNLPPLGARAIQRPGQRRRNRGGPRSESERIARGPRVIYDFRYVRADLQWIALTSAAAVGAVLLAWLALRV